MNLKMHMFGMIMLLWLHFSVQHVDSYLTVNHGYESPYKCNAGLKDVIFTNKPYTLYCDYGIHHNDSNLESVVIGKGTLTLFDFQGAFAYIKGDIQGRSHFDWTPTGVNITVNTADITRDKAEYKCSVVRYDPDEDEEMTFELNRIYNLPSKEELTAMLQTQREKYITLNPGFVLYTISVIAKNYPKINCSLPKVTWSGDSSPHSCHGMDGDKEVECSHTIKEEDLSQGKTYVYQVNSEQYGVKSDTVRFTVRVAKATNNTTETITTTTEAFTTIPAIINPTPTTEVESTTEIRNTGFLTSTTSDLNTCIWDLSASQSRLSTCQSDLSSCQAGACEDTFEKTIGRYAEGGTEVTHIYSVDGCLDACRAQRYCTFVDFNALDSKCFTYTATSLALYQRSETDNYKRVACDPADTSLDGLSSYFSVHPIDYSDCRYGNTWGACSNGYVGVGACASGSNWFKLCDCGRYGTKIICCRILTTSGNSISTTITKNWWVRGRYGVNIYCHKTNEIVTKVCGSGSYAACKNNGYYSYIMCSTVPSGRYLGNNCKWLWGTWGERLKCPDQMVMHGFCSGGRYKNCNNNNNSHGVYCCDIV